MASRRRQKTGRLKFFQGTSSALTAAEFDSGEEDSIVKEALLMVEGIHIDSKKRRHQFPRERIQRIANNTNNFVASGGRVPWQQDHKKDQSSNLGDLLEDGVELRVITPQDLPNPRSKHLLGKLGIFGKLIGRGADVVSQVVAGRVKTLSPGIDVATDTIKEISATPTPAIVGLSTFALSWEDIEQEGEEIAQQREDYDELCDKFWDLIQGIQMSGEEELQGSNPTDLMFGAVDGFAQRLTDLLGLNEQQEEEQEGTAQPQQMGGNNGAAPQGNRNPGYLRNQQDLQGRRQQSMQQNQQMQARSGDRLITMSEVADARRAEFQRQRPLSRSVRKRIARALKGRELP